jgi:hypothetical protein
MLNFIAFSSAPTSNDTLIFYRDTKFMAYVAGLPDGIFSNQKSLFG